jgi:integrase
MVRHDSKRSELVRPTQQRIRINTPTRTRTTHNQRRNYNRNTRNYTRNYSQISPLVPRPLTFTIPGFGLSLLALSRFTPGTLYRYRRALEDFCQWTRSQRIRLQTAPSIEQLDRLLAAYCCYLQRAHKPFSRAQLTLSAAQAFRPSAKRRLPNSSAELSGWRRITISRQHPPLTWPVTCAIAYRMAQDGHSRAAVCVLLAFDCLLRIGELVGVRPSDILTPIDKDPKLGWFVTVRLPRTKTGMNQSVRILSSEVARLTLRLKAATKPDDTLLVGMSSTGFRNLFKSTCKSLQLDPSYVPHSLRHGGATRLAIMGKDVSTIKTRGRWKSLDTCERYMQIFQSVIGAHKAPKATVQIGNEVVLDIVKFISGAATQYAASVSAQVSKTATAAAGTSGR